MTPPIKIVRIRKGTEWLLGHDKFGKPEFGSKESARVCKSEASARALLGMTGFQGAVVEVEDAEPAQGELKWIR